MTLKHVQEAGDTSSAISSADSDSPLNLSAESSREEALDPKETAAPQKSRLESTSVQCAISQNSGIVKTSRKSSREIEKQFLTVHYPLYYKIILMILTKIVDSAFKGSFYLNVGAINCPAT